MINENLFGVVKNSILIDDIHNLLSKFEEYSGTAFHISSFI